MGSNGDAGQFFVGGAVGGYQFPLSGSGGGGDHQVVGSSGPPLPAYRDQQLGVGCRDRRVVSDNRNRDPDFVDELLAVDSVGRIGKKHPTSSSMTVIAARLEELRRRGEWPAIAPSVVLAEALTGDHRRDYFENRLLRACEIKPGDELLARSAARLRAAARTRRTPSAVDAIVVAVADEGGGAVVLSSDLADLRPLAQHTSYRVAIAPV